jgi:hypothetical protein
MMPVFLSDCPSDQASEFRPTWGVKRVLQTKALVVRRSWPIDARRPGIIVTSSGLYGAVGGPSHRWGSHHANWPSGAL